MQHRPYFDSDSENSGDEAGPVPFLAGFAPPSPRSTRAALGDHLMRRLAAQHPPDACDHPPDHLCFHQSGSDAQLLYDHSDDPQLFPPLPTCASRSDWLASVEEEPESVHEFLKFIGQRLPGRSKEPTYLHKYARSANPGRSTIYILPVGEIPTAESRILCLPALLDYTRLMFPGFHVRALPAAHIAPQRSQGPGVVRFQWRDATPDAPPLDVALGRTRWDKHTGRRQLHVDPLLSTLGAIRASGSFKRAHPDCFCVMGLSLGEDLYSHASDLFVAGMAAGGSKVAVFSLARYDPRVQFSRSHWYEWRFVQDDTLLPEPRRTFDPEEAEDVEGDEDVEMKSDPEPEEQEVQPEERVGQRRTRRAAAVRASKRLRLAPQARSLMQRTARGSRTGQPVKAGRLATLELHSRLPIDRPQEQAWLLRSLRLLVHELGHLFGLGHCVYFACLMNGSGHLGQDFQTPMHLCPVDLAKLKLRLGRSADLLQRYRGLLRFYDEQEAKLRQGAGSRGASSPGGEFASASEWIRTRLRRAGFPIQ